MEWVRKHVFERGYWKSRGKGGVGKEVEALNADEGKEVTDGITEDKEGSPTFSSSSGGETGKRWTGIVRCVVGQTMPWGGSY